jgi:hypothetical protein
MEYVGESKDLYNGIDSGLDIDPHHQLCHPEPKGAKIQHERYKQVEWVSRS